MARLVVGVNDLATTHPHLANEWDVQKNGELLPSDVSAGSVKPIHWVCSLGHSFSSRIDSRADRSRPKGCPYCAGRKVLAGFNDIATTNPAIAAEWDTEKNGNQTPQTLSAGSSYLAHWVCPQGHSYATPVKKRTSTAKLGGCLYCTGGKVLAGFNDIATTHAHLVVEWDFKKNKARKPNSVSAGSGYKAHWNCPQGHSYASVVRSRSIGKGCPRCVSRRTESDFRDMFNTMTEMTFVDGHVIGQRENFKGNRIQVDMLNDEAKIAIEYDGHFSHGGNPFYKTTLETCVSNDMDTTTALLNAGYKVVRIRETPLMHLPMQDANLLQISYKDKSEMTAVVEECIEFLR